MGAPLPLKRSTHRRTIIIEGHRGLQEEIVVIEGIAGMNVGKGLVHIAHLSAVLVLQRAVVQRETQALLARPQHQAQARLLTVLHRQSACVGVVEQHPLGRIAQGKA